MGRHCGDCKYFGEKTGQVINDRELHRCHNDKSIFKGCLSSATGCNKFEKGTDLNEAVRIAYEQGKKDALEVLDKIRAEIESMDFDFGDYYDNTNEIIEMVCKVIDKYKGDKE